MAKSKQEKQKIIADLEKKLSEAKGVFVIAPNSINPNEASELKIKLAEIGGNYHVVKNSLFKIALKNAGLEELECLETGQNAVIFVKEQSPEAAKIMKTFIKEAEAPKGQTKAEFQEAFFEGKKLTAEQVNALADLPSKEQLIAQVIGTMNAPIQGIVNVFVGNIRGIVNVIDAYQQTKTN
jgi:large subunit ribosomal protein L10